MHRLSFIVLMFLSVNVWAKTTLDCRCKDWSCDSTTGKVSCTDRNPIQFFCPSVDNPGNGICCVEGKTCVNGGCVSPNPPITTTPPITTVPITTTPPCNCYEIKLHSCGTGQYIRTICCNNEIYNCDELTGCIPDDIWDKIDIGDEEAKKCDEEDMSITEEFIENI